MNKRFQELSYEAQRYALNNTTGSDLAGLNELWQEKFAELIVRECVDIADDYDGVGSTIVSRIKQHFGIEPGVEI